MIFTKLTFLAVFSLLYILAITYIYFSKARLNNSENRIYKIMIIVNIIGIILHLLCDMVSFYYYVVPNYISMTIYRLYLIYFVIFINLLFLYLLMIISIKRKEDKKVSNIILILMFVECVITTVLPLNLYKNDVSNIYYTYGSAVDFIYIISAIIMFLIILLVFIKRKKIHKKKLIPIYVFILLGFFSILIQNNYPEIVIITEVETIICCLMYFTIENPDIKMLEELYKNKKIIEKNNENTSNFLFKISQSIKNPVRQIIDKTSGNEELIELNNLGKELEYTIDDVLDVTKMTTKSLKLYTSKYNPRNLFNELKYRTENGLDKNIRLEYKISPNIPNYVYGDSIKLKQVLSSVLENSINHTDEGFIEFEINTIIKYGICRFIIDITDSGKGISIDKVNDILSLEESIEKIDDEKSTFNLKEVKAVVEKLGGSFMIKSDEDSGTTVSITIDQKIIESKDEELQKKLEIYEESLYKNKKIMVIDDDAKELSEIVSFFEKNDVIVHSSLFGKDIVEKISNKHKYDLIILDDETNTGSALSTLQELKKNDKFNIPVVVMLNDNKEFIKLHYLKDGFADTISKSKLKEELERILKRF